MPQKFHLKRKPYTHLTSMVGMVPGLFFVYGDEGELYRKIQNASIEGADNGIPNCMRMSDGELVHLPFSSLIEEVNEVTILFE